MKRPSKKLKPGKDFIGIGIGGIILDKKGKFLLIQRGPKSKNEVGFWGFPGGALEFGETIEEAIIREVKEELGVEIKPLKKLPPVNHRIPHEKQHWMAVPYVCHLVSGKPKIKEPDKISKMRWFSIKDAGKLKLSLVAEEVFKEFKDKYAELEDYF